ncbi:unnamed protein product [Prorocentrum cordatum]|uniref:Uncharacterized protein n=1 Tax=Prorocentrum cordatum TaxID=2364126 RepID=A0ABN9QJN8_9DINO|nr:unnamed protein product [Polarella glacialis]
MLFTSEAALGQGRDARGAGHPQRLPRGRPGSEREGEEEGEEEEEEEEEEGVEGVHAARALVLARPTPRPRIGDVPKRAGGRRASMLAWAAGGWRDGTGIGRARSLGDPATPRNRLSHSSSLGFGMNMLATGSFAPSRNSNR